MYIYTYLYINRSHYFFFLDFLYLGSFWQRKFLCLAPGCEYRCIYTRMSLYFLFFPPRSLSFSSFYNISFFHFSSLSFILSHHHFSRVHFLSRSLSPCYSLSLPPYVSLTPSSPPFFLPSFRFIFLAPFFTRVLALSFPFSLPHVRAH